MRVVEVLKVISFGSETRLYAAARCDLHIGLETVGGYWLIAASYDGLLSTLGLRCPRAAIDPMRTLATHPLNGAD